MVDFIKDPDCPRAGKHRELEKAEGKKGEEAIQRTIETIRNFTNPFTISDKDRLYSLASGAPVLMEVEMDVLQAETVGKRSSNGYRAESQVIQYQEQSNLAFLHLVKSQRAEEPLDLEELPWDTSRVRLFEFFGVSLVCPYLNKAALLHYILEDTTPKDLPYPKDALFIQDGMALIHVLTNLPPTCGEICLQVEVRELPTIYSNQEETDTGWYSTFILLLPLESLGEDCCATLLGFHVFSGEDCTSAFKGKGKAFSQLGDNWNVKPEVLKQLEQFTCLIYGESRESSVDAVRAKLLRKMVGSKVDLARLPPCYDALKPHVQRLNHPCTSELMNPF
ncbi:hypothetical protein NQZ68_027129 [Dissostichus eleginoides]|nr:hypothetical protein NQZ68_027129 [Dissostichus eleginoides]